MTSKGYVYTFWNHFMPDVTKVGYTLKHPDDRARELSSATGVPGSFVEKTWWLIDHPKFMEKKIHLALRKCHASKEFYHNHKISIDSVIEETFMQYGEVVHTNNWIEYCEHLIKNPNYAPHDSVKNKQKLHRYLNQLSNQNKKAKLIKLELEEEYKKSHPFTLKLEYD